MSYKYKFELDIDNKKMKLFSVDENIVVYDVSLTTFEKDTIIDLMNKINIVKMNGITYTLANIFQANYSTLNIVKKLLDDKNKEIDDNYTDTKQIEEEKMKAKQEILSEINIMQTNLKSVVDAIEDMNKDIKRKMGKDLHKLKDEFLNLLNIRHTIHKTSILTLISVGITYTLYVSLSENSEDTIKKLKNLLKDSTDILLNIDNMDALQKELMI
jgi:hypothetical protein